MIRFVRFVAWAILGALPACAQADPERDAFVRWARDAAIPIESLELQAGSADLEPLRALVGDARVVGFGQSHHQAREQLLLAARMFRFLVEEQGFTRLAIEESLPSAAAIDAYLLTGEGDPAQLLTGLGGWYLWDIEELLALVRWMRSYNADPAHTRKLRFHGFDVTEPRAGYEALLAFLERADPELVRELRPGLGLELLGDASWEETIGNHAGLSDEERTRLAETHATLRSRFEERRARYATASSEEELERIDRYVRVVCAANALFAEIARGNIGAAGEIRERAQAENVGWLLAGAGAEERMVVWAHDFHVAKAPLDLELAGRPPLEDAVPMGAYLAELWGQDYLAVGAAFDHSAELELAPAAPGSVDGVLARVGPPRFLLDLRACSLAWPGRENQLRGQGASAGLVPGRAFDALLFVDELSATRPSAGALRRRAALRAR